MKLTQSFYQSLDEWIDVSATEPVNVFDLDDLSQWDLLDTEETENAEDLCFSLDA